MKRKQQTTLMASASCSKRQKDTSDSTITVDEDSNNDEWHGNTTESANDNEVTFSVGCSTCRE